MQGNLVNRGIIYGPVNSRRFGLSLGINLSGPSKICSYNCLYCFRGFNQGAGESYLLPAEAEVQVALSTFLAAYNGSPVCDWSLAGNGEPTDNPHFPQIVARLLKLRKQFTPGVLISLLTNGMGLVPARNSRYREFLSACSQLDRVCIKLDTGRAATWARFNNPCGGISFAEWFSAVRQLKHPLVQTMLVHGRINNTTPEEIQALRDCIDKLNPRDVQILTLNKRPADFALCPVTAEELERIRRHLAAGAKRSFRKFHDPYNN